MLRVTSGMLRGFKLEVPKSASVRPPLEMARQAVFNILGQDLEGLRVADLFAGSGVIGIEALSRGAVHVLFVEKDRDAVGCIKRNLEKTRMAGNAAVVAADAFHTRRYLLDGEVFDLVFIDPPFAASREADSRAHLVGLIDELFSSPALAPGALLIIRVPSRGPVELQPSRAMLDDDRVYGSSRILFFRRAAEGE